MQMIWVRKLYRSQASLHRRDRQLAAIEFVDLAPIQICVAGEVDVPIERTEIFWI